MNVPPKWAMMFSVCIPIIGQFIFVYVVYQAYVNLQFIRPETKRTFLKDALLCALTGGTLSLIIIPLFFREVELGGKRMNVIMPNYLLYSIVLLFFLLAATVILLSNSYIGFWFVASVPLTYLFISPFELIYKEYADYM